MAIEDFYTTSFTNKRSVWTEDVNGPYSEEDTISTFKGHLQQARMELVQSLSLSFTKTFTIWCAIGTNVKAGDTLISGTNQYSVHAVMNNNVGDNKHIELLVELDEQNLIGS